MIIIASHAVIDFVGIRHAFRMSGIEVQRARSRAQLIELCQRTDCKIAFVDDGFCENLLFTIKTMYQRSPAYWVVCSRYPLSNEIRKKYYKFGSAQIVDNPRISLDYLKPYELIAGFFEKQIELFKIYKKSNRNQIPPKDLLLQHYAEEDIMVLGKKPYALKKAFWSGFEIETKNPSHSEIKSHIKSMLGNFQDELLNSSWSVLSLKVKNTENSFENYRILLSTKIEEETQVKETNQSPELLSDFVKEKGVLINESKEREKSFSLIPVCDEKNKFCAFLRGEFRGPLSTELIDFLEQLGDFAPLLASAIDKLDFFARVYDKESVYHQPSGALPNAAKNNIKTE